jgi:hypothetical protein
METEFRPTRIVEIDQMDEAVRESHTTNALPPLWHALSPHRKGQPRPRTLIGALLIDRAADLARQRDDQF